MPIKEHLFLVFVRVATLDQYLNEVEIEGLAFLCPWGVGVLSELRHFPTDSWGFSQKDWARLPVFLDQLVHD